MGVVARAFILLRNFNPPDRVREREREGVGERVQDVLEAGAT